MINTSIPLEFEILPTRVLHVTKRIIVSQEIWQAIWNRRKTEVGHLMALEALMISLIRGTPRVMFMEATPAKWNVFRVIWVPGSPMLWAQSAPTAEPGSICALQEKDMDESTAKLLGRGFWYFFLIGKMQMPLGSGRNWHWAGMH